MSDEMVNCLVSFDVIFASEAEVCRLNDRLEEDCCVAGISGDAYELVAEMPVARAGGALRTAIVIAEHMVAGLPGVSVRGVRFGAMVGNAIVRSIRPISDGQGEEIRLH